MGKKDADYTKQLQFLDVPVGTFYARRGLVKNPHSPWQGFWHFITKGGHHSLQFYREVSGRFDKSELILVEGEEPGANKPAADLANVVEETEKKEIEKELKGQQLEKLRERAERDAEEAEKE